MRVADKFTLSRILLSPVIFALYHAPRFAPGVSKPGIIVLIALTAFTEFTDFLDGFYARRHGAVSDFGKLFDPFADVTLHITLFVCFTGDGYMPLIILLLILYREFSMLFLRLLAVQRGVAIGARKGGKAKTVLYVASSFCALLVEALFRFGALQDDRTAHRVLTVLFCLCAFAAYASFIDYL
ncbi:MAG: CDP-diacylglycerol--glycerol-3-phosphate 3-phosphatidyltransferase, partial [Spirochaetaceae bacterium]|nr:CDP-diacylglycerol--glycerol-3-phosphate 3-phosphatidyltransferase [Spirochaetaceae bacterium]